MGAVSSQYVSAASSHGIAPAGPVGRYSMSEPTPAVSSIDSTIPSG